MSYTIITKSKSNFLTNVNSEQLLGFLCKDVGAKYFEDESLGKIFGGSFPKLAYKMTKKETEDAVTKLKTLIPKAKEVFPKYKNWFEKGAKPKDFIESLNYFIDCFEKSKGYKVI